eukprot:TRINITY_DN1093_c0_g1_i1.p1 TRINITY_DN1093_c0_g1~~TRINITY_DN1093_c0_g1_i1.p1  ORF type:complete len:121 (-),score=20.69 TRINITY_DN1093_c0_g1_i1:254-616(-)
MAGESDNKFQPKSSANVTLEEGQLAVDADAVSIGQQNNVNVVKASSDIGKKGVNDPVSNRTPLMERLNKPWLSPGRYVSPTDRYLSPISQTLLFKNRKGALPILKYSSEESKENFEPAAS